MLENETNVQETTEPLTENNDLQKEQETKMEWQPFLGLFFGRHLFLIINWS